jgi:hypothetical protein
MLTCSDMNRVSYPVRPRSQAVNSHGLSYRIFPPFQPHPTPLHSTASFPNIHRQTGPPLQANFIPTPNRFLWLDQLLFCLQCFLIDEVSYRASWFVFSATG